MHKKLYGWLAGSAALLLTAGAAVAQDSTTTAEVVEAVVVQAGYDSDKAEMAFILNTFSFLISGALVMWMAAGFAMLESGLVRSKNTASICLKNVGIFGIACIMYYLFGYNLMYGNYGSEAADHFVGTFSFLYDLSGAEAALINADEPTRELVDAVTGNGYAVMSDWFFQVVFVATAASIVSGTLAERIKIWPFFLFTIVLTAILYPITGSWTWGGGWLSGMGFSDFAGSTIVHSVGGWAALAGALVLGARKGKFGPGGKINPMPGSNLPLATLGTFILWLGWFGFNGGSQLALGSALDAANMALVYANTNLAACGGLVVAMVLTQLLYGKVDLSMSLNGAIAGLVAITAGPDIQSSLMAIIIGGVGGVVVVVLVPLLDRLRIDDVVGAVSVHLGAGIWGTLAVGIFGSADLGVQITGIVAIGAFTFLTSLVVFLIIKAVFGLRPTEEDEEIGLDKAELGMEAYPEFGQGAHTAR